MMKKLCGGDKATNYGASSVDLAAPGTSIWTLSRFGDCIRYAVFNGTSAASPHVAGVDALRWGKPVKIWSDQVKDVILNSVDPKSSLTDYCVSGGMLNANNAFESDPPDAPSNLTGTPTAWELIELDWQDNSSNEIGLEVYRKKEGEGDYSSNNAVRGSSGGSGGCADGAAGEEGNTNYYKVRAYNLGGNSSFSNTASVTIPTGSPAAPDNLEGEFSWGIGESFGGQISQIMNKDLKSKEKVNGIPSGNELEPKAQMPLGTLMRIPLTLILFIIIG